jgi:hypothetical protein
MHPGLVAGRVDQFADQPTLDVENPDGHGCFGRQVELDHGRGVETFRETLLTWERSGFSVYGEQVVHETEEERLERLARYVVRAPAQGA